MFVKNITIVKKIQLLKVGLVIIGLLLIIKLPVFAKSSQGSDVYQALVTKILEEKESKFDNQVQKYQKLELEIQLNQQNNQIIILENGQYPTTKNNVYKTGDRVLVSKIGDPEKSEYLIVDYVRYPALRNLFILFIIVAVVVAKWKGVRALLGMGLSFLVIYYGFIASIYNGIQPVVSAIIGSIIIIPLNYFLAHGVNKKTLTAVIGTVITLCFAIFLTVISIKSVKLTGLENEDASFVSLLIPGISVNMQGILLAGIIIGLLGVLDDITISQASIVSEIHKANPKFKALELYNKAMNVGKDHIASVINTLLLVYTGASLPLLLLFYNSSQKFYEIISYEIVADEIVRTLVGSISLIIAVPITTLLASFLVGYDPNRKYESK